VPIGVAAVRSWCRGGLGHFDRKLHTFLIPLPELRAFVLKKREFLSNSLAADFVSPQTESVLTLSSLPTTTRPANAKGSSIAQLFTALRERGVSTQAPARPAQPVAVLKPKRNATEARPRAPTPGETRSPGR
jgi:hypothetical protein